MYVVETGIICVERDERFGGMSAHFRMLQGMHVRAYWRASELAIKNSQ